MVLIDFPMLLFSLLAQFFVNLIYDEEVGEWGLMVASPMMYMTALKAFEHHTSQVKWNRCEPSLMYILTVGGIIRHSFDTCTRTN